MPLETFRWHIFEKGLIQSCPRTREAIIYTSRRSINALVLNYLSYRFQFHPSSYLQRCTWYCKEARIYWRTNLANLNFTVYGSTTGTFDTSIGYFRPSYHDTSNSTARFRTASSVPSLQPDIICDGTSLVILNSGIGQFAGPMFAPLGVSYDWGIPVSPSSAFSL
jgi:hypothetical protein